MKKLQFLIPLLALLITFTSCEENAMEESHQVSNDELIEMLAQDVDFQDLVYKTTSIQMQAALNFDQLSDAEVEALKSGNQNSLNPEIADKLLNLDSDEIRLVESDFMEKMSVLHSKYPKLKELSQQESEILFTSAVTKTIENQNFSSSLNTYKNAKGGYLEFSLNMGCYLPEGFTCENDIINGNNDCMKKYNNCVTKATSNAWYKTVGCNLGALGTTFGAFSVATITAIPTGGASYVAGAFVAGLALAGDIVCMVSVEAEFEANCSSCQIGTLNGVGVFDCCD